MIASLIGVFVLWLFWRSVSRSSYVEIAPPPPSITINVYIKDVHVIVEQKARPPLVR